MLLRHLRRGLALTTLFVALACVPAVHAVADTGSPTDPGTGIGATTTPTNPAMDMATTPRRGSDKRLLQRRATKCNIFCNIRDVALPKEPRTKEAV